MFDYDKSSHQPTDQTESAIESTRVALLLNCDVAEIHAKLVNRGFTPEQAHFVLVAANMLIKTGV